MLTIRNRTKLTLFGLILAGSIFAPSAIAATFTVTNTNDTGAGSLRQAVLDANVSAGNDTIEFDSSFNTVRTITLASAITITGNGGLAINGPGAALLTISGNNMVRVFEISSLLPAALGPVSISNLTIADGRSFPGGAGSGAAIGINNGPASAATAVTVDINDVNFRNNSGVDPGGAIGCIRLANVTVANSNFSGNRGSGGAIEIGSGIGTCDLSIVASSFSGNGIDGGRAVTCCGNGLGDLLIDRSAFFNNGSPAGSSTIRFNSGTSLQIINTTIAHNRSSGPALQIDPNNLGTTMTLTNNTIAHNYASSSNLAGGIGTANINILSIGNSIVANNFNASGPADLQIGPGTTLTSLGYNLFEFPGSSIIGGNSTGNLIGIDPWLDSRMRENGGATKSLALLPGSPAIDVGNPTSFPTTDQRGISRPQDGDENGSLRSDIGAFERRSIDNVPGNFLDLDGDGKTDVSVFRPVGGSGSEWWYLRSSDGGNRAFAFGEATDTVVPADFTGDGKTDLAFWRPTTGEWFVLRSEDSTFFAFPFGAAGDVPSPADFDGDGKSDATVYRPSTNTWFTLRSSDGQVAATPFGTVGDKPVPADYDGDGKADVAIFRPTGGSGGGEWWYLRSSDGANRAFAFGSATDLTVPGDYTGDGKADLAYFRPSTGEWYVLRSEDSSFFAFPWGSTGDLPAPGDYDGDGKIDAAVFRPSNSNWFALRSTAGPLILQFGTTGDRPLPNAFVR